MKTLNDELKQKYLEEINEEQYRVEIITSFDDDELKETYLNRTKHIRDRIKITSSFKSDLIKEKYYIDLIKEYYESEYQELDEERNVYITKNRIDIEETEFNELMANIVRNFKSTELREKYIEDVPYPEHKAQILVEFEDDKTKTKKRYLDRIGNLKDKADVIASVQNYELKKELFDILIEKVELFSKLEYDSQHQNIYNYDYIIKIIASIKDDKSKEEYLIVIDDDNGRAKVIASLESDELKIKYLNSIEAEENRTQIISSLMNDELKIQHMNSIEAEENRTQIITSLIGDELKKEYLDDIKEEKNKVKVLISLSREKEKIIQDERESEEKETRDDLSIEELIEIAKNGDDKTERRGKFYKTNFYK